MSVFIKCLILFLSMTNIYAATLSSLVGTQGTQSWLAATTNAQWPYAITLTIKTTPDSNSEQKLHLGINNYNADTDKYRVAKTLANQNWYTSGALTLSNDADLYSATVNSVSFQRTVKIQLKELDISEVKINNVVVWEEAPADLGTSGTGLKLSDSAAFSATSSQAAGWYQVTTLVAGLNAGNGNSQAVQTMIIDVTYAPAGAQYRVLKTTATADATNPYIGSSQSLTLGENTITVDAVTWTDATQGRDVKVQFSSDDIEFAILYKNGNVASYGISNTCDNYNGTICTINHANHVPNYQNGSSKYCYNEKCASEGTWDNFNACCELRDDCSDYTCPADTHVLKNNAHTIYCAGVSCDASAGSADKNTCCDARQKCDQHTCPEATHVLKTDASTRYCAGASCTSADNSKCCDNKATCSDFICPSATKVIKSNPSAEYCVGTSCDASADIINCCDDRGTCSDFDCGANKAVMNSSTLCAGALCDASAGSADENTCCGCVAGYGYDSGSCTKCTDSTSSPQWNAAIDHSPCGNHDGCSLEDQYFDYNSTTNVGVCKTCDTGTVTDGDLFAYSCDKCASGYNDDNNNGSCEADKNCVGSYDEFSTCTACQGTKTRVFNVVTQPTGVGTACKTNETKGCCDGTDISTCTLSCNFISDNAETTSNANYPYAIPLAKKADGALSQNKYELTFNVDSLPVGGANYRVYKTVENTNVNVGTDVPLTLGVNTITVPAVTWTNPNQGRDVKIQFSKQITLSSTKIESYDDNDVPFGRTLLKLIGDAEDGTTTDWPYVIPLAAQSDGPSSQGEQELKIYVDSLPDGGANYRVYKTVENTNVNVGTDVPLTLGVNTITVPAVTWTDSNQGRDVKIQFSSGEISLLHIYAKDCPLNEKSDIRGRGCRACRNGYRTNDYIDICDTPICEIDPDDKGHVNYGNKINVPDNAFSLCDTLTSFSGPNVTSIAENSFGTGLYAVYLPKFTGTFAPLPTFYKSDNAESNAELCTCFIDESEFCLKKPSTGESTCLTRDTVNSAMQHCSSVKHAYNAQCGCN